MKDYIKGIVSVLRNHSIALEYPWSPKSRTFGSIPIFEKILPQLQLNTRKYREMILKALHHLPQFIDISEVSNATAGNIHWKNNYLPGLDMVMIYTMINELKPLKVIEIGSGHSTAVMRKAIIENKLNTHITCIDPTPRRNISDLADECIPHSLESLKDHRIFFNLSPGDVVFFDGSHISLANSDVTVFFMEILPHLPVGIIVHIHDIYLPFDYPEEMARRGYNEQYLLAQALIYTNKKFEIIFPAYWVSKQEELQSLMIENFWSKMKSKNIETHGGSFWIKINE